MFSVSIIGMFVYKEVTSNDAITSSSSMGTFLMQLENIVEFLALLFSSLTLALRMLAIYLLRLYYGELLYRCEINCNIRTFYLTCHIFGSEMMGFKMIFRRLTIFVTKIWTCALISEKRLEYALTEGKMILIDVHKVRHS